MGGCGVCGEQNPDSARFCSACGAQLGTSPAQTRRVRRSVTILFADIAGFTSLAEQLDPELLHAVTQRYFAAVREVVERHGGVVEKFIGDAVMAAFGVPVLHEDDALRAVRAASEIGPSLGALNAELSATTGRSIQVRIGVNTGEVITGDVASGATFVTGEAVNIAARLEQTAEPGDILLGPKTYRLVRKQITAEVLAPIAVKGITEPLVVHRLVSVDGADAARSPEMATPMVGRDAELAVLEDAYARAVSTNVPQLVTVLGPPGIGKSRLLAEFAKSTEGALSVKGRCLAYGEGITYWPIAEIVRGAAGISEADTREQALARVRGLMAGAPDAELVAHRVAAATGLEPSGAAQEELRWAIRRFIERLAEQQPLIVIIEDIHWAEPTLLEVIEHLVAPTADIQMLLACPARLDLLDRRPAWSTGAANMRTVTLEGLPSEGADRLLLEVPGGAALPDDVRAKLLELSEGNPLFLEEIVGTLVETGDLRSENGSWRWAGSAAAVPVPPTVEALVAGRLEVLPPDELIVLERAAVIGRAFDHRTLSEMLNTDHRFGHPELDRVLSELLRKRLITEEPGVVGPDLAGGSFRFRHQLIRDGAYARLSKSDRAELHEWFAVWLERDVGDRLAEYEEIVGYHFEVASRYRRELGAVAPAEHLGKRAVGHLAAAARRAMERLDPSAAATLAQRSADLLSAGDPHRVDLLLMSAQASHYLGHFRASEATVGTALAEAREASLVREEAWARLRAVLLRSHLSAPGYGDAVLDVTDAVMPVFTAIGDDNGLSVALRARVVALLGKGDLRAAEDSAVRAVAHAERSGDVINLRNAHITWAETGAYGETTVPEALERAEYVFGLYPGQLRVQVEIGGLIALLHARRLEIEKSRRLASQAEQTAIELNVPWLMAGMRNLRGHVEWIAGNVPAAVANWRAALDMWRAQGDDEGVPFAAAELAGALAASGEDDEAIAMADLADQSAGGNYLDMELLVRGVRALVAARRGQADEALAIVTEDARRMESSPDLWLRAHVLLGRATVLARVGDVDAARSDAFGAMNAAQRKGDLALAARVQTFLDELAGRPASLPS